MRVSICAEEVEPNRTNQIRADAEKKDRGRGRARAPIRARTAPKKRGLAIARPLIFLVEKRRIELPTSALRSQIR